MEHCLQLGIALIRAPHKQTFMKSENLIDTEKCVMPVTWDTQY